MHCQRDKHPAIAKGSSVVDSLRNGSKILVSFALLCDFDGYRSIFLEEMMLIPLNKPFVSVEPMKFLTFVSSIVVSTIMQLKLVLLLLGLSAFSWTEVSAEN